MAKENKMDVITSLVEQLNAKRKKENKVAVTREWTGAGHWLKTDEYQYVSLAGVFTKDDEFIGFLEGLLFEEPKQSVRTGQINFIHKMVTTHGVNDERLGRRIDFVLYPVLTYPTAEKYDAVYTDVTAHGGLLNDSRKLVKWDELSDTEIGWLWCATKVVEKHILKG